MMAPIDPQAATVLVVEDNPDNLMLVMDLLQEIPVQYCNARASGRQLFKLLEQRAMQVDLVLLDIQIPREDGYEVLRQIRATPALAKTKVVAVTANVMESDMERTQAAGFDGLIGKPLKLKRFPEQIRRILAGEAVWEPY
jgi:two-component system, cell cycle response regulator DivK